MKTDGEVVQALWIPQPSHTGFQEIVHGGIIATVLDEMMAWACGIFAGRFAYSAEISIRYRQPLTPGEHVTCTGRLLKDRRHRILKAGALLAKADGSAAANAAGTYLPISLEDQQRLLKDFTGDISFLRQFLQKE